MLKRPFNSLPVQCGSDGEMVGKLVELVFVHDCLEALATSSYMASMCFHFEKRGHELC